MACGLGTTAKCCHSLCCFVCINMNNQSAASSESLMATYQMCHRSVWFSLASSLTCVVLLACGPAPGREGGGWTCGIDAVHTHTTQTCVIHLHAHTHAHTHTHTFTHMYTHTYTFTHTYTHTYTHMHTQTYLHIHTHMHTHTYTHAHTCTHTYTHKHTYTFTHKCTHTCTHTYTFKHHTHLSSHRGWF